MMTIDEIKEVMSSPKSPNNWSKYVVIYEQITGRKPAGGCASCKLTHVYNTILQYINKHNNN